MEFDPFEAGLLCRDETAASGGIANEERDTRSSFEHCRSGFLDV
jgi:hypothetical protein